MKKIKIEFTNERIIPASGLAVVSAILGKCDFVKRCNRMGVTPNRSQHHLLEGDTEVNTWWTNLGMTDREVIGLYHAHGECEQFHSEIKTDMDVERLPSGKFETNELVLELTILAYNILRMIGQESMGRKGTETKHKVRRRRLRTVIGNMIMMASRVTEHARQLLIGLGRSNIWQHAFAEAYTAFADFQL